MIDCAHRTAASRGIRKSLDEAHRAWLARREQGDARRSSLIKLAYSAMTLHSAGFAKDVLPRTEDERSKPLLVALTAMETIRSNEGA
jgi:hypothetical protein